MADFVAAFVIDDSTILSRLHLAAVEVVKKNKIKSHSGDDIVVLNSGFKFTSDKELSKNFKEKEGEYYLEIGVKENLKIFDGTLDFLKSSGYFDLKTLQKASKNHTKNDQNTEFLKELKTEIFKAIKKYFIVFAGANKVEDLKEDHLMLVTEFPFENGEVKDKEGTIGFKIGFTIGLE